MRRVEYKTLLKNIEHIVESFAHDEYIAVLKLTLHLANDSNESGEDTNFEEALHQIETILNSQLAAKDLCAVTDTNEVITLLRNYTPAQVMVLTRLIRSSIDHYPFKTLKVYQHFKLFQFTSTTVDVNELFNSLTDNRKTNPYLESQIEIENI